MTPPIDPALVSTTDSIPGYQVTLSLGIAEGFALSAYGGFTVGGRVDVIRNTTAAAFMDMLTNAAAHGANAIIAVRYVVPSTESERLVIAYGTAVKVAKTTS